MGEPAEYELPADRWMAEFLASCRHRYRTSSAYRKRLRVEQIQAAYQYRNQPPSAA